MQARHARRGKPQEEQKPPPTRGKPEMQPAEHELPPLSDPTDVCHVLHALVWKHMAYGRRGARLPWDGGMSRTHRQPLVPKKLTSSKLRSAGPTPNRRPHARPA